MGNNTTKLQNSPSFINLNHFEIKQIIGIGGFSKVWAVQHKTSKKEYAMKQINKFRLMHRRCINPVLSERKFLSILKHPFIVNMQYAFQDRDNLYLLMDYMRGGDLRYWLHIKKIFSENETRFFAACIITGLEYLHINHVIHRDIKPENLVFDYKGYLRITDFGIAKRGNPKVSLEDSGTPGYMAPEVMRKKPHGPESDYFSLGVVVFECMIGKRPYIGRTKREIRDRIFSRQVELSRNFIPNGWSMEAADFVNKCIERKPKDRLGVNGIVELKNHAWFRGIKWAKLFGKKVKAPLIPDVGNNFDESLIMKYWNEEKEFFIEENFQAVFAGYYYDKGCNGKRSEDITKQI